MTSKNNNIEALRGLAILLVLIGHIGTLRYWNADLGIFLSKFALGSGVDLFFCISGFVITSAYYDRLSNSYRDSLMPFAKASGIFLLRRLFRIMPAAVTWLLVVCACSVWFNTTGIFGTLQGNLSDLTSVVLNFSNFHFAKCIADGYTSPTCGYNGVYWSISLEEQFYLLFPLFVLVKKRWIAVITFAVFVALYLMERDIFIWFTRVDGLLLGVCLGFISRQSWHARFTLSKGQASIAWPAALAVVCYAIFAKSLIGAWAPAFYPLAITLLCGSLVFLASIDRGDAESAGTFGNIFVYIGSRSFSLYLAHNPVFWIAQEVTHRLGAIGTNGVPSSPTIFTILSMLLLIALTEISYRLIEVPFRDLGRKITTRTATPNLINVPSLLKEKPSI